LGPSQQEMVILSGMGNVFFLHWKIDPILLVSLIPSGLNLDLYENHAWVSFDGFGLKNGRPRGLPSFPVLSHFSELNLRTYVTHNNKAGVHFLSVECSNAVASALVKCSTEVPYESSKIEENKGLFQAQQTVKSHNFQLNYSPGEIISNPTELDRWLPERSALHQGIASKNRLISYDIHHKQWSLQKLTINSLLVNYPSFNHFFKTQPTLTPFSAGVTNLAWSKIKQRL
jgi:uncharacterized protein YqjF (DUF2071 family)